MSPGAPTQPGSSVEGYGPTGVSFYPGPDPRSFMPDQQVPGGRMSMSGPSQYGSSESTLPLEQRCANSSQCTHDDHRSLMRRRLTLEDLHANPSSLVMLCGLEIFLQEHPSTN